MKYVFRSLQVLGVLVLIAPLVFTLGSLFELQIHDISNVFADILWVGMQAFLSASLSLFLGLLCALSLIVQKKFVKFYLYFSLLPQFLPSLLMIFAYVQMFSYFKIFPQSYMHVIVVHALLNIGLISFLIYEPLKEALTRKLHLLTSLSLTQFKYVELILRFELRAPLLYAWVLVFAYCLSSFSVPLILSGQRATSFEYLIYTNGFVQGNWGLAAFWGVLQFGLIAYLFQARPRLLSNKNQAQISFFKIKFPLFFLGLLPSLLILFAMIPSSFAHWWQAFENLLPDIGLIFMNTALLCSWTLFFYTLFFWSQVIFIRQKFFWSFYQRFWSLSPILLGVYLMAFSTYFNLGQAGRLVLTALILAAFIFPLAFKFWIWPRYQIVENLNLKIKALNLAENKAIDEIIIEFFKHNFFTSLGYVFLFALGDFAISSILLSDTPTLGLSIKNYIFRYKLTEAQILSTILAFIAVMCFVLFRGKNEFNKKL